MPATPQSMQALIEYAWDAFAILDPDGTVRYGSPSNRHVFGYDSDELVGKDGLSFVHPEDLPAARAAIDWVRRRSGQVVTLNHRFLHHDGTWRHLETVVQNLLDHPAIGGFVVHSRDVTEQKRLDTALQQAQLQVRRLELHPHFILNVLHTIQMQLQSDPEAASDTLERLGDLLRLSFTHVDQAEVPLVQEITFLERYLDLYRLRFPDRLSTTIDVPEAVRDASVPTLVLQPLVENALRHGLADRPSGWIGVCVEVQGDTLLLTVADDGGGLPAPPDALEEGVGLSNTRTRLRQLYDSRATLTLQNRPEGGVEARVRLPLHRTTG